MAFASPYDHIFDVPLAKRGARAKPVPEIFRRREHVEAAELEFSEYGRDPRYPSGWYIVPALLIWAGILAALVA